MMRFVLAEDTKAGFTISPLQGNQQPSMTDTQPEELIPGSIKLINDAGETLTNASVIIYILHKLGGLWVLLGCLVWLIPRPLRDFGHQMIAKICQKTPLIID